MSRGNIASYLPEVAATQPFMRAVIKPGPRDAVGRRAYTHLTFAQLDAECDRIAHGLKAVGISRGTRTLLAVKPGLDFIAIAFALFKLGAVPVMIDPGMGKKNLLNCVRRAKPEALVAIPLAHAIRKIAGGDAFASVKHFVTVGRRLFWGGPTLDEVRQMGSETGHGQPFEFAPTTADEMAAILFTTGATGPPKGVVYTHGIFIAQTEMLRERFGIGPGDIDLPGFPLFALFSTALGASAVIPDMDPSRPATVNPQLFVESITDQGATYSFGSPAIWNRVTAYCLRHDIRLPSLRLVLMAGAPVPPDLFARFPQILRADAETVTPYGATECLPMTTMTGREVLAETAVRTRQGDGVCVGKPLAGIEVRTIKISDGPIENWSDELLVPPGEPGEICFAGAPVTKEYFDLPDATALAKIRDGEKIWHRIGDCGTLDAQGRIWFFGRKAHRVVAGNGDGNGNGADAKTFFSVRCEAIFNQHPAVFRSALVGVGQGEKRRPVIIIEPLPEKFPRGRRKREFIEELLALGAASDLTREIREVLFHSKFPVDFRHNAKIIREELAVWAAKQLGE